MAGGGSAKRMWAMPVSVRKWWEFFNWRLRVIAHLLHFTHFTTGARNAYCSHADSSSMCGYVTGGPQWSGPCT
jgi:hypothetical protein